ncbi:oligosaccharide flippase family protein [Planktomarina temperata]|nr:oligosaccharide flippase family protein [Planktomarina temperata]
MAKEGSWIVVGQIATVLGALVLVRVLTEHLEPTQYGQLALGLTVAGLVNQIVMGGVTAGIGRFYSIATEKNDLPGYLHASIQMMGYATVVVVVIALVLMAGLLWLGYSQWMGLAAAALVLSVLSGYNSSLSGIQNAARQRAIVAIHSGLGAWLKVLLAVGVMLWLGNSSTAVVLGYVMSSLLVTVSQLLFLRRLISAQSGKRHTSANWGRQMWVYSWPFMAWGIFGWAQQSSGRWALEVYSTTTDVGLYTVVFQLGYSPIIMAIGLTMTFFMPILFARAGDASSAVRNEGVRKLISKMVLLGGGLTVIAVLVTSLLHSQIFNLLVNEKYFLVSYLLPWVILSGGLFGISQVLASQLMVFNMTLTLSYASIGSSVIGIAASIVCVKAFSLDGMIVASLIHSTAYFLFVISVLGKNNKAMK